MHLLHLKQFHNIKVQLYIAEVSNQSQLPSFQGGLISSHQLIRSERKKEGMVHGRECSETKKSLYAVSTKSLVDFPLTHNRN